MQVCCTHPNCNRVQEVQNHFLPRPGVSVVVPRCDCGMPLILDRRYIPEKALGHGGFGRTFLASDSNFPGSKRVIKQFSSANLLPMQIQQAEQAFERESRILDKLRHPKIPRVSSYFTVRAEPNLVRREESQSVLFYMAQDYVEGQDLQRELQAGRAYSEKDILILLRQILDVLSYIHDIREPVIHCDIKLSNIIHNSQDNTYHLIDFGAFQRVIIENLSQSSLGIRFASPGFSPQEQYDGRVDASSDLYALGMTCICLLTGNIFPIDLALSEDRGQWKKEARISPNLTQVLSKMIELKPGDRYRTVADVQKALNLPPTIPASPLPHGLKKDDSLKNSYKYLIKKNSIISSIITFVSVALIIVLGHFFYKVYFTNQNPLAPISLTDRITDVTHVPSGTFRYGGSTTWSGLIKHVNVKSFFPNFDLKYVEAKGGKSNSEAGASMLINGELDFALSSNKSDDVIEKAAQNNIKLDYIPVAISGFSVAVNPKLNVSGLTTGQYDSIIKGRIRTWNEIDKEVGTKKLEIRIYATDKKYLDGAEFFLVKKSEEAFQEVAKNLGGLHISATALVVGQCKVKGLPVRLESSNLVSPYKKYFHPEECSEQRHSVVEPKYLKNAFFSRNLYVVVVRDGGRKEKAGMAYAKIWLTNQGQEVVSNNGYQKISK